MFRGRITYNAQDIKLSIRLQQAPIPTLQYMQDVSDQTEMIYQDVRRNAMQAFIKYKAYYDKTANVSKFKEAENLYVLQLKADHHAIKIPLTDFRWIGLKFMEEVLPYKNHLRRKIGTSKTQAHDRMR